MFKSFITAALPYILYVIALALIAVIYTNDKKKKARDERQGKDKKNPDELDNYALWGMCAGMAIGIAAGSALGRLSAGMSLGMLYGLAAGLAVKKKRK